MGMDVTRMVGDGNRADGDGNSSDGDRMGMAISWDDVDRSNCPIMVSVIDVWFTIITV